jgi:hypothetical protein
MAAQKGQQDAPAIPEKFGGDVGKLVKAYAELEAKLGQQKAEPKKDDSQAGFDPAKNAGLSVKDAKPAEEIGELDFSKYSAEFQEKGVISEESYKELAEKYRIPKQIVDSTIEGLKAQAELVRYRIFKDLSLTDESFDQMITWAATNLSSEQLDAYDRAVTASGDLQVMKLAVQGLKDAYEARVGFTGQMVQAQTVPAASDIFESEAQVMAAMRDPRYAEDPAYQQKVINKLARSPLFERQHGF